MGALIDFAVEDEYIDERRHVVTPYGEIDALTAPRLGQRLLELVDRGKTGVVVDLSGVTFMDSTGIGVLLHTLRRLALRHGTLVLVCPTERVMRPFEITGVAARMRMFATREEALGGLAAALV